MNEEQKNKAKEAHGKLASWLVGLGVPANWSKVGAGIIIGAGIGALSTCQQSCKNTPRVQLTVEQVQAAETIYTALGGEVRYRVIPVEDFKK
jgi:hypothetical protein